MKFILFAEGHTEKFLPAFFKAWLDPRLNRPVGFHVVRFKGWGDFVESAAERAVMHLSGAKASEIIAVVGLLDLYGPGFYPDNTWSARERHDWAVNYLAQKVNLPEFRMFFAVHELEAWILSQPDILPQEVAKRLPKREPETINFDEPPSKLLNRAYHACGGEGYKKRVFGGQLFHKLDPSIAATKCPHLNAMLQEMLSMAKNAGL